MVLGNKGIWSKSHLTAEAMSWMAVIFSMAQVATVGRSTFSIATPPFILEGAVDGGNARSGAILLGESVKEGLSAGLVKQVVVAVLDEQRELSLQHDFKVICFALLE